MKKIYLIAKNSWHEAIRDRFVFISIFVSIILFGFSILLGTLSFAEQERILANLGFTSIYLAAFAVSVFMGSFALKREIEKQTCLLVLARPVSRAQFLLGKFLGIAGLIFSMVVILAVVFAFLMPRVDYASFVVIILGILFENLLLLAIAVCGSSMMSSSVALMNSVGLFLIGHWIPDLMFFAEKSKQEGFMTFAKAVKWVMPNLYLLNWRSFFFLETGFKDVQVATAFLHSIGWIVGLLALATIFFRRKDIV